MNKSEEEIKRNIKNYIDENGGQYSLWYIGISENPDYRLFLEHNVDRKNNAWIFEIVSDSDTAKRIEDYLVNILGTDSNPNHDDKDARVIYAYKKKPPTRP